MVLAFVADQGGLENCSEVKIGLLRRLAAASVLVEQLESKAAQGEPIDVSMFCQLASTTVRLSQRLGVERHARDVTTPPSVADYIDHLEKVDADA